MSFGTVGVWLKGTSYLSWRNEVKLALIGGKKERKKERWWKTVKFKSLCNNGKISNRGQFSSAAQSCPTLCNPMDYSTPGLPVHYQLPDLTQINVHWVGDAIQPSHPLLSPFPPAFNLSQHQGLFKRVSFSHQAAKVLELQLQHQSFQCIFRTDLL